MTEKTDNLNTGGTTLSPLEGEGLRGDGTAKWYVIHTYSGYENKVKTNIEKMVEYRGMQDLILEVAIPTEDRVEIKNGQRKVKTRKLYPGYVVIKMIVNNETWYLVRNTEGVTGFVGHGSDPIPLTKEEVVRMGVEKMRIVEDISPDKQIVRAKVSMFGRDTPVELEFSQVGKLN